MHLPRFRLLLRIVLYQWLKFFIGILIVVQKTNFLYCLTNGVRNISYAKTECGQKDKTISDCSVPDSKPYKFQGEYFQGMNVDQGRTTSTTIKLSSVIKTSEVGSAKT